MNNHVEKFNNLVYEYKNKIAGTVKLLSNIGNNADFKTINLSFEQLLYNMSTYNKLLELYDIQNDED